MALAPPTCAAQPKWHQLFGYSLAPSKQEASCGQPPLPQCRRAQHLSRKYFITARGSRGRSSSRGGVEGRVLCALAQTKRQCDVQLHHQLPQACATLKMVPHPKHLPAMNLSLGLPEEREIQSSRLTCGGSASSGGGCSKTAMPAGQPRCRPARQGPNTIGNKRSCRKNIGRLGIRSSSSGSGSG